MPDLSQIKLLNEGFGGYVVLVENEFILRIAKHAGAMAGHDKEQAVLPCLQKRLPVQVPQPIWRVEPSDYFPFGAIGYRRISGIPFALSLVPEVKLHSIAHDLAQFLVALHDIPAAEMTALGVTSVAELESLPAEVMPALHTYLAKDEYEKISAWWERFLNHPARDSFMPKLVHGDPWGENIILNETLDGVAGVVDFETVSIGDAAQDFVAQKYVRPDFSNEVIERYRELGSELGNHFAVRQRAWSMLRELRGLRYALRYPGSGELEDSLQKIRRELTLYA